MRKIAVVTGTRAEYGLLKNTIDKLSIDDELMLQLIVTGTHLSDNYGYTVKEIEQDGYYIEERLPILMDTTNGYSTAISMSLVQNGLANTFLRLQPDILLILGDRYEIFAAASVALAMNIPIAHISGGEITEGAMDDQIRHAITKMAHLHFPGNQAYAENIKNMGEEEWRIFNFGDPAIENIKNNNFLTQEEILKEFGVRVDKDTLLITFHPTTLEIEQLTNQVENLILALNKVNKNMVITYPNSDNGGQYIINKLIEFESKNKNVHLFKSLGMQNYLSIMKLCGAVVGNSSSAIVEAPYLKIPTVNIGNRQKGRLMASSIIQCGYESDNIVKAVNKAFSIQFRKTLEKTVSLFGDGKTSDNIVKVLKEIKIDENLMKKKLVW